MLCCVERCYKKWKIISPRVARLQISKVCTFRLPFSTVYNILASFSNLSNPQVQYSIHVETYCTDLVVVPRPGYIAFAACSTESL